MLPAGHGVQPQHQGIQGSLPDGSHPQSQANVRANPLLTDTEIKKTFIDFIRQTEMNRIGNRQPEKVYADWLEVETPGFKSFMSSTSARSASGHFNMDAIGSAAREPVVSHVSQVDPRKGGLMHVPDEFGNHNGYFILVGSDMSTCSQFFYTVRKYSPASSLFSRS